jgi:hypothetical protein
VPFTFIDSNHIADIQNEAILTFWWICRGYGPLAAAINTLPVASKSKRLKQLEES